MAPADTMAQVLDHLQSRWGGAVGFLADQGVAQGEIDSWRDLLVGD
jgi:hypothetical protein